MPDDKAQVVICVLLSIALYNVLELCALIATTFKRFRGLYCWSFLVATAGIALNAAGFLLRAVAPPPSSSSSSSCVYAYAYGTAIALGWCSMVTGQSLVLYSRLHIVLHWERFLRGVLFVIVLNAVWLGIPVVLLFYLSSSPGSSSTGPYAAAYAVFEKLQLTIFFLQEAFLSSLYVAETCKILRSHQGLFVVSGGSASGPGAKNRRILSHLLAVNVLVMALDVSVLGLEFANCYDLQTAWKPLVYSAKLKLEFGVLTRLVDLSQRVRRNRGLALIDDGANPVDAAGLPLDTVEDRGVTAASGRSVDGSDTESSPRAQSSAGHKTNEQGQPAWLEL